MKHHALQNATQAAKKKSLYFLGLNLANYPPVLQFIICSFGVFFFYLVYGFVQEVLFKTYKFPYHWFAQFVQFTVYALLALFGRYRANEHKRRGSMLDYTSLAFFYLFGRGFGTVALNYTDYTTKIIFQSSKVIPVMVIGIFMLHKRYSLLQYLATVVLVAGLIIFSMADAQTSASFSIVGVLCLLGDLFGVALKSNIQEKIMHDTHASSLEVSLYGNVMGVVLCLPLLLLLDELIPGILYCAANPVVVLLMFAQFLFGYLGSLASIMLIHISDSFVASLVESTRKIATMSLSFILFTKPFTALHLVGSIVFFGGLLSHIVLKRCSPKRVRTHPPSPLLPTKEKQED